MTDVDLELDCRGMLCPQPVIQLARRIVEVQVGGVVGVVSTDAASGHDIPAWCRMRQQEFVGEDLADDGSPRFVVRRVS